MAEGGGFDFDEDFEGAGRGDLEELLNGLLEKLTEWTYWYLVD